MTLISMKQDEKDECHIEVIIKEYLIPVFGLEICEKYSMPNWIALGAATLVSNCSQKSN